MTSVPPYAPGRGLESRMRARGARLLRGRLPARLQSPACASLDTLIQQRVEAMGPGGPIRFEDLFCLEDIQRIQDEFARATGVASIITRPDGSPITAPSSFTRLCRDIIRKTPAGCANCIKSDALLGTHSEGPLLRTCLSGGLWDAGASISVEGRHIASWLIGQVRDDTQTEPAMRGYAREIGADEEAFIEAFREVPVMSRERFQHVAQSLFTVANHLSESAYQNVQQARFIVERNAAEEALRTSEAQNRALLSAIPDLIFTNHRSGEFLGYKAADPRQLFMPPERFLHRNVHEVMPEPLASQFKEGYQEALDTGTIQELVYTLPILGRECHYEARIVPCTQDTVITIVRDVTARKEAEQQQRQLQAQFQQAQKMESLGNLAGGVAHDMNNVLGAILGLATANLQRHPPGSPAWAAFETIARAAQRGGGMVRSLLDFARRTPASQEALDMNAILREEMRLLEHTTLARIQLRLELAESLPPILGDAGALSNAIMNLCVNAVDALADNGTLTLRTLHPEPGWIQVEVEDTGCGMPEEVLGKALDPFFTTKPHSKGTGLGLSMVYSTVKAHGGTLEIHSRPGAGTRVRLRFPARRAQPPAEVDAASHPPCSQGPLAILVVDDDDLIRTSLEDLLEVLGHPATLSATGEEALSRIEGGFRPDVVLLDLNMPGLGGAGTLPRLRDLLPEVPVILTTGGADPSAQELQGRFPRVHLLGKPFGLRSLEQQLQRALLPPETAP